LGQVNRDLVQRFGERRPEQGIATVDQDATITGADGRRVMLLHPPYDPLPARSWLQRSSNTLQAFLGHHRFSP
jgi:hypothetical protein